MLIIILIALMLRATVIEEQQADARKRDAACAAARQRDAPATLSGATFTRYADFSSSPLSLFFDFHFRCRCLIADAFIDYGLLPPLMPLSILPPPTLMPFSLFRCRLRDYFSPIAAFADYFAIFHFAAMLTLD